MGHALAARFVPLNGLQVLNPRDHSLLEISRSLAGWTWKGCRKLGSLRSRTSYPGSLVDCGLLTSAFCFRLNLCSVYRPHGSPHPWRFARLDAVDGAAWMLPGTVLWILFLLHGDRLLDVLVCWYARGSFLTIYTFMMSKRLLWA